MSKTNTRLEYSKIGNTVCPVSGFSRVKNVIKNIRHAAETEYDPLDQEVKIHFVTKQRHKEMHRIIYVINFNKLTDDQKTRVLRYT